MTKERSKKDYKFGSRLKHERLKGVNYCCERCGKFSKDLEVHHLMGAWLASQNPLLTPEIIRVLENEMCLCPSCHIIMNADQETWDERDIGFIAWALFDLDPSEVEKNQKRVYGDDNKGLRLKEKEKGKKKDKKKKKK